MNWLNKIMTDIANAMAKREYGLKERITILTKAEREADKRFAGTLGYKAPFMQGVQYAIDMGKERGK